MSLTKHSLAVLALSIGMTAGMLHAQPLDLLQTWQLATEHDPEYRARMAQANVGATRDAQARSLWLPTLGASATAGRGGHKSSSQGANFKSPGMGSEDRVEFNNSITGGDLRTYEIALKQPIFSRERLAQSRQLRMGSELARLEWQHTQQQLMLRAAERYFDVLISRQATQLLEQQHKQAAYAEQETRTRFELGDRPVTDIHEATAQARNLQAMLLNAQMQQQLAEAAYADLTGQPPGPLLRLPLTTQMTAPELGSLAQWLSDVTQLNPAVQMQDMGADIALESIAQYASWKSPTLDLVGRLAHEKLDGSGRYGSALNKVDDWMLGIQINVPIFTGGYRSAKRKEALYTHEQRVAEAEAMRQQVRQQARTAWHAVQVSSQQVDALQQALEASRLRVESTRLGVELGDKTTLEKLDAESQHTRVQIDLLNAKVALIMHQLQLAALVGSLDRQHLQQANLYLQ
mgnify:CR=1 FL=1